MQHLSFTPHLRFSDPDPALDAAQRDKVTLTLGLDPGMTGRAFEASRLYLAWSEAEKRLEAFKAEFREYAVEKREIWNQANLDKVKTLKIPFRLSTERGTETRYVSVSCTASYTTDQSVTRKIKKEYPKVFQGLFSEETETILRPRGKNLLKTQLLNAGVSEERIRQIFSEVFESQTTVTPVEDFEYKVEDQTKGLPMARQLVDLAVRRANPAVTFEVR